MNLIEEKNAIISKWIFKDIIKSEVFFWHNNNFILVSYANVDYERNIDIKRQIFGLIHKLELKIIGANLSPILSDNQSCIKLVDNPVLYSCTKHIEIKFYFI
uniref:Reverse transcriptase Ty1/copia-type domain-containing protein n=1 Tax=Physcomitrium patens TaxID=3218 RepID=A0A2K1III2_PHYPA|nr:hypothetical protein PHYPA_027784 [Physcomitrium patens]